MDAVTGMPGGDGFDGVHALNRVTSGHIRECLAQGGRIHGPSMQGERLVSGGYRNAEKVLAAHYATGDVAAFRNARKQFGFEMGRRAPDDRRRSQDFWDCFDRLDISTRLTEAAYDDLERAQSTLLDAFRGQQLLSQRVLAYDTTNFHTWIASTNQRCQLPRRDRNKQERQDLRQLGLSYALDGTLGLALCHHLYPGNLSGSDVNLVSAVQPATGRSTRNPQFVVCGDARH